MPWALALAAASPAAGVLLYAWLHDRSRLTRAVDGFVYVAVPGLVAWEVLPSAWNQRSALPVAAVALGLGAVTATERALQRFAAQKYAARTDDAAIVASLSGVGLHALLEGAALAVNAATPSDVNSFAWAVILHRIPVGLVIWWLVRPRHGPVLASLGVATIPVATLAGYFVAAHFGAVTAGPGASLYHTFVAGTLLHVVFHQGRQDHDHGPRSA